MKGHKYVSNPVDKNGRVIWSDTENETWKKLFTRQKEIIKGRACDEFAKGLEIIKENPCHLVTDTKVRYSIKTRQSHIEVNTDIAKFFETFID